MSFCDFFLDKILPTSAISVAFARVSYGNEPIYGNLLENPSLFHAPHPISGPAAAQAHIGSRSFRKSPTTPFSILEAVKGTIPVIEECGIGTYLYLYSLKYFAAVFAVCSLFAVVQAYLDYGGGYYNEKYGDWSQYFPCWGNSQAIPRNATNQTLSDLQNIYEEMTTKKTVQVALDTACTGILLIALVLYAVRTRVVIERHRNKTPTLADYAVKFTQLPEARIPEVAAMLESAGIEIHEMVPVRHVNKLLNHLERFDLRNKYQVLEELKGQPRYVAYRDFINLRLGKLESLSEDPDIIEKSHSLIVVFEHREGRAAALKLFRKMWINAWWQKVKVLWHKLRGTERNWVSEVNAKWMAVPDEVYWDNIKKKQYISRIFYYWIGILVILATVAVVYVLRNKQSDVDSDTENDNSGRDSAMNSRIQSGSIKFLIGACITVINVVIPWLNQFLTLQERQSTLPRIKLSALFKMFLFMLINSDFVILIVNANFRNLHSGKLLSIIDGRFKDLSRDWYLEVGFAIQLSMLLGVFSPHVVWCVYYFFKQRLMPRLSDYFDTQLAYNHWALGGEIDLPCQTAIQLVAIFCCLNYSGGMPLMLPTCCLMLISMFMCEVWMFRYLRKPRENSTILHTWFLNLLPWAVVLHCWFSAYLYGAESIVPGISPTKWYYTHSHPVASFSVDDYLKEVTNDYQERASDYCGKTFLILSGTAIVVVVVNSYLQRVIRKKYKVNRKSVSKKIQNKKIRGGESYYIFRSKNYTKFYKGLFGVETEFDEEGKIAAFKKEEKPRMFLEECTEMLEEVQG